MYKAFTPFLIFALALSLKDVLIKQSIIYGQYVAITIFFCGVGLALYSFLVSYKTLQIKKLSFSYLRFFVNLFGNIAMVLSIAYLDATTVNIVNKASIPLIIVLGAIFGFTYSKKERFLSVVLISFAVIYVIFAIRINGYSSIGFMFFLISLVCISLEFLFLAKQLKNVKSLFELALPPALAFIVGGGAMYLSTAQEEAGFDGSSTIVGGAIATLAGIALGWAYSSSKLRYKYLPPGLADSPTIIAFFFIYALEVGLGVKLINFLDLAAASLVMLFSLVLIFERAKQGSLK